MSAIFPIGAASAPDSEAKNRLGNRASPEAQLLPSPWLNRLRRWSELGLVRHEIRTGMWAKILLGCYASMDGHGLLTVCQGIFVTNHPSKDSGARGSGLRLDKHLHEMTTAIK